MYNFNNLSDFEFEILCKDIMQKKLGIKLYTFQKGRDGGIDITDNPSTKSIIIQVKHYINSKYSDLISSLRKEIGKVKKLNPQKYYVCCAVKLTAKNKQEIYELFSEYMESANSVLSLLYNIEEDSKEFVATHCYYECLEILE